jgi:hypothetical protein
VYHMTQERRNSLGLVVTASDTGPSLRVGSRQLPVILPTLSDPRLHLAAVIITIHVLGQVALGFHVSIVQILLAIGTCAFIDFSWTLKRTGNLVWPASGMLTGSGVGLILRVVGTEHGDWWSTHGWYWFVLVAGGSLVTKYVIRYRGGPLFNPSNLGLVVAFLLLGSSRVEPLDFWWTPLDGWMIAAYAVILGGGLAITARLKLLGMAVGFWVTLALGIGVLAGSGHCITTRWSFDPVCGSRFWWVIVTSPEILVFLFFMITDPKTVPTGRVRRVVFGCAVALVCTLLIAPQTTEFGAKVGLLGGLVIMCAVRPLFDRLLASRTPDEDSFRLVITKLTTSPARVVSIGSIATGLLLLFGVGVIAAGSPARLPVRDVATTDIDNALGGADVSAAIALLPVVEVDPLIAAFDNSLTGDGAQKFAGTLIKILEVEAAALLEGDPERLAGVDFGTRLQTMQERTGRSEVVLDRYTFHSLYLTIDFPFGGQAGASPALVAAASLDEITYDAAGNELSRLQWACDGITFPFVASPNGGWLLVDVEIREPGLSGASHCVIG